MQLYEVLKRPLVTEKSTALSAAGKYVFEVGHGANKYEIKDAVQKAFKVTVMAVNVITVPGEMRRVGRNRVFRQPWKKAIVTLKEGDKITIFEGV
jgi:large subunit ribosomal protein L23